MLLAEQHVRRSACSRARAGCRSAPRSPASISSRTSPISLSGNEGCSRMSASRSRQSLASFDSAVHPALVLSFVACASSVPPTKSIALRDVVGAARLRPAAEHRRDEVGDAERVAVLVVAARLHGDAEADDRQLLARHHDDLQPVLQREALDRRQRQLGRLGRRAARGSDPCARPRIGVRAWPCPARRPRLVLDRDGPARRGGLGGLPARRAADARQPERQQQRARGFTFLPPGERHRRRGLRQRHARQVGVDQVLLAPRAARRRR